jgi:hypothetical protein
MSDGLRVALTSPEELREKIEDRAHWIVVFGHEGTDAIDKVDEGIGAEPTYPTAFCVTKYGVFNLTAVPKIDVSRDTIHRAITEAVGRSDILDGARPDQDLFILAGDDEIPAIAAWLKELVPA